MTIILAVNGGEGLGVTNNDIHELVGHQLDNQVHQHHNE